MCVGAFFVESLEGISEEDAGLGIFKTFLLLTSDKLLSGASELERVENILNQKSFPTSW